MFVRTEQREFVHRAQSMNVHKATVDDTLPAKYIRNQGIMVTTSDLGGDYVRARPVVSGGVKASHEPDCSHLGIKNDYQIIAIRGVGKLTGVRLERDR